jgi:glycosyltransferase AglD
MNAPSAPNPRYAHIKAQKGYWMKISVFLPVYNEEHIVEKQVRAVYTFLQKTYEFELVVVNDNSLDSTGKILARLKKNLRHLRVITFHNGPSRRENLAEAMKTAKYPVIVFMDLDLAVPLKYVHALIRAIADGNDVAFGSRYLTHSKFERSAYRLVISKIYHTTIHFLFHSKISDYQCGFKAFKKKYFMTLLKCIGYDSSFTRGWFWDAEILIAA